jgi:Mce-associated membrane protein
VTADDEAVGADLSNQATASNTKPTRRLHINGIRYVLGRWGPILLMLFLIAALGWASNLFYFDYRPDQQTDRVAAREVITAASDGAVALLSYSPDSLSRDIDNAKSRLTTDFQASYKRFTDQIVTPAAQRGQLTTTVRIIRAAAAELHPNSAVVLVFISQTTTSKEKPELVKTTGSVRVNLTKVKGAWLISKFDSL